MPCVPVGTEAYSVYTFRPRASRRTSMRFGAHYLPTYIPELDGTPNEFYRRMFEQMELLDEVGFDDIWVTEHHFHEYGGMISHPPTFLSAVARTTKRVHLGTAISVL